MADEGGTGALHDALGELYAADPDEFVLVRSRLERSLRAAGEADAAAEIRRRRRPHLAAWACNQLARREPEAIAALVDVTASVADAQRAALTGKDGEALRESTRQRQSALDELTEAGLRLLRGHAPKPASYRDNIAATLDAASLDAQLAAQLRAGSLTQALSSPSGFGPPPGAGPAGPATPPARKRPDRRARERGQRALEDAQRRVASLRGTLDDATAEQTSADIDAQSAAAHVRDVEEALQRAREAEQRSLHHAEAKRAQADTLRRELADAVVREREAEEQLRDLSGE